MSSETPRRRSKLAEQPPIGPPPADTGGERLQTRSRRRRPHPVLRDTDLVSFNCKLTLGCRRAVRTLAAELDVDIQDVVEQALVEYLQRRGVTVDRRPPAPGNAK